MTTNKSNHRDCLHPSTKSARAKCRADRARVQAEVEALFAPEPWEIEFAEMRAAADIWDAEFPKFAEAHQASAHQNADDTAHEEGFEPMTKRWYECAVSTLHHARDTAESVYDRTDPQSGQAFMVKGGTDYLWVDTLNWDNGWVKTVNAVDCDGNRSIVQLADIDLDD